MRELRSLTSVDTFRISHKVLFREMGHIFNLFFPTGELHTPETNGINNIAVKVLKEGVSNEIISDFEREVEIMSAFDHDNILKLLGVVATSRYRCEMLFVVLAVRAVEVT